MNFALEGYEIEEEPVHVGHRSLVVRARRLSDQRNVILKTTASARPSPSASSRLEHEHAIGSRIAELDPEGESLLDGDQSFRDSSGAQLDLPLPQQGIAFGDTIPKLTAHGQGFPLPSQSFAQAIFRP